MTGELCALTFLSVHDVLRAEKLLNEAGVTLRLIPVPKQVSADCGMEIQIACAALPEARRVLAPLAGRLTGSYRIDGTEFRPGDPA